MRLQTKYMILKATTIFFGAISIPWSTFTGYCFGDGRYLTALISLACQTVVALVDGYIWFWVLENMKNKLQGETSTSGAAPNSRLESCPFINHDKKASERWQPAYSNITSFSPKSGELKPGLVAEKLELDNRVDPYQ